HNMKETERTQFQLQHPIISQFVGGPGADHRTSTTPGLTADDVRAFAAGDPAAQRRVVDSIRSTPNSGGYIGRQFEVSMQHPTPDDEPQGLDITAQLGRALALTIGAGADTLALTLSQRPLAKSGDAALEKPMNT